MNAFISLKLHLERHMYKRGRNKGEAPADASRRSKFHFRVLAQGNTMVVRMHGTNILTAYEDGSIMVSTGGWWTNTTRACLNHALWKFVTRRMYVHIFRKFGLSQPAITHAGGATRYFYDGIRYDAEGELLTQPVAFERKRKDKDETAEFRKEIVESGFKDAFPVLYQSVKVDFDGSVEVSESTWLRYPVSKIMSDATHASYWPTVAALVKYPNYKNRYLNLPAHDDWRDAWKSLMATATKDMTEVVRTDVMLLAEPSRNSPVSLTI